MTIDLPTDVLKKLLNEISPPGVRPATLTLCKNTNKESLYKRDYIASVNGNTVCGDDPWVAAWSAANIYSENLKKVSHLL